MSGWRAAVVAAVVGGLILGAGFFLSRNDGGDPPGTGTVTTAEPRSDLAALACPTALDAVCRELAAVLGTTSQRYTPGTEPGLDVVVLAPLGDLPDDGTVRPLVARSPVAIAVWLARSSVLQAHCGADDIDLGCLAQAYGRQWADLGGSSAWGDFKIGLADATRTEAGLAAWRAIAAAGVPDGLAASLRLVGRSDGALMVEIAQFGDSRADVMVTTEVAIAAQLANVQGRGGRLDVYYPDPAPWVDYVAAGTGGDAERLIEALLQPDIQERLGALGLRPAAGDAADLMDGLGTPGRALGPLDDAGRGRLLDAWNDLR